MRNYLFSDPVHSMDSDEAFMSPPPKAALSAAVFPTPEEIVSKMQAEVLRKECFITVLGTEVVDSWGFDWSMLKDPAVSFGDPYRISVISSLHTKLQNIARKRYDAEFDKLHTQFLKLRERVLSSIWTDLKQLLNTILVLVFQVQT